MGYPNGNEMGSGSAIQHDSLRRLAAETAKRTAHIPDELGRVEKSIESIVDMVSHLETRLDTALRPAPPMNDAKATTERPGSGVPLATALATAHARLCYIAGMLSSLLDRIEL